VTHGVIERGTIVIRDGLIAAVGPEVAAPADARVLDLAGKTVFPAFIDLTSSLGLPSAPAAGGGRGAAPGGGPGGGGSTLFASGTLYISASPAAICTGWIAAIRTPLFMIVVDGHTFTHSGSPPHRSQMRGAFVVGWKFTTSPGH